VPSSDPVLRFSDIIENIERIERFTAGMDLHGFARAEQTVLAVKYSLLVISEAAAKLGDLAADLCPAIPWREIRGLGNRLRHDYPLRLAEHRSRPRLAAGGTRPAAP